MVYRKMQDLMEESGGFIFVSHEVLAVVHRSSIEAVIMADDYLDIPRTKKL